MNANLNNQRDTNQRDFIHTRNQGNDKWNNLSFAQGLAGNTRNIFALLSEIQRYYVIESRIEELPKEYFTTSQILEYFRAGFKRGLLESFLFVIIVPFLQIIYPSFKYYFLNAVTTNAMLLLQILSYSPIVLSTIFMIYIGRYYQGSMTKRAILALINGRILAFILKGILFYFLIQWFVGYSLKNPNVLYVIADYTSWIVNIFIDINTNTEGLYKYYYVYLVPALRDTALKIILTMMLFAVFPYLTIFFKSSINHSKKYKIKKEYENY